MNCLILKTLQAWRRTPSSPRRRRSARNGHNSRISKHRISRLNARSGAAPGGSCTAALPICTCIVHLGSLRYGARCYAGSNASLCILLKMLTVDCAFSAGGCAAFAKSGAVSDSRTTSCTGYCTPLIAPNQGGNNQRRDSRRLLVESLDVGFWLQRRVGF